MKSPILFLGLKPAQVSPDVAQPTLPRIHLPPSPAAWRGIAALALVAAALAFGCTASGIGARWAVGALICGGVVAGFLAGMLGIGGALITVPLLWFVLPRLGVSGASLSHVVVASSLVAMLPTGIAAAWGQHRRGNVDFGWVGRMAPAMAAGALVGAWLAADVRGTLLAISFAGQSLYFGSRLLLSRAVDPGQRPPGMFARAAAFLPAPVAGVAMAAYCACVGMGGGSMVAPYLMSRGLSFRRTVATCGALNLCIAAGGSLAFAARGALDGAPAHPAWLPALLLGGVAAWAASIGVALAAKLSTAKLGGAVGLVNIFGAVALLAQAL